MTLKSLATGVAAAGVVAAGVAGVVTITPITSPAVQLAVFGVPMPLAPMPLDPAALLPSADQLTGVLVGLADPSVPFNAKGYLVEGGIGRIEARTADALMRNAVAKGQIPLSFAITNIVPAGPGLASATVTATGPGMAPTTQTVTFVDQGGWKLSRSSASTVLSIFSA